MTSPRGDAGDVYVNVHANTDPVDPELKAGLEKATRDAEKVMDAAGEALGETLADSTADELGKHGKDFTEAIEDGIKKQRINIDGEWFTIDRNGQLHNSAGRFAGRLGDMMADEVADAFAAASRPGGPFSKVGEAISDAIGAGFNVSGRSPLVGFLVPAIGAIVTAVFGAIQAVNGLSAALVAVPPLIAAIGLQITVLTLALDGVGKAMTAAFSAKNATELKEALKDLTPAAQQFVKSMLPVKTMFDDLKKSLQENFFQGLGNSIAPMLRSLIEITKGPLGALAKQLGEFFAGIARFFDSKVFAEFVTKIIPATVQWLDKFGPVFVSFLEALTRMATVAIPFLSKLGDLLNKVFIKVTNRINEAVEDGSLEAWLDDMLETLKVLGSVFASVIGFVRDMFNAVDDAGGNAALAAIGDFFKDMGEFFSSPVGIQALKGMIGAAIVLTKIFEGLIFVISSLFALVSFAAEAIAAFFTWLVDTALPAVGEFFAGIGQWIADTWFAFKMFFADIVAGFLKLVDDVVLFFVDLKNGAIEKFEEFIEWCKKLPGKILDAIGDLAETLWDAGVALLQGLWDGVVSKWNEFKTWLGELAGEISNLKGPLDKDKVLLVPAGEAIMDGLAKGMKDGAKDVFTLAAGITDTLAGISTGIGINVPPMDPMSMSATQTINLNMGGLNFDGAVNEQQAAVAGKAAAGGAMSQMQQRNTRLLVRMI